MTYFRRGGDSFAGRSIIEIENSLNLPARRGRPVTPPDVIVNVLAAFNIGRAEPAEASGKDIFEGIANRAFPTPISTRNDRETSPERNGGPGS